VGPGLALTPALALSLALAACTEPVDREGAVVESEVVAATPEDDEELQPGEPSLADPALNSVTRPAPDAAGGDDATEAAPEDLDRQPQ